MAPKTDVIEQLRARIAELTAEVERLSAAHVKACQANADSQAELAKAEQRVAEWQPISTAPKDGSFILLATPKGRIADGFWSLVYGVWSWPYVMVEPTHWMPLPTPPKRSMEGV